MRAAAPRPLADRRFRRLFAAQVVSLLGSGLTTVALALLAYDLAGDDAGVVLGAALALKMVAYVLVAPTVAGLLDRVPRRRLLVGLDLARAAVAFSLPWIGEVWQALLLVFALSACSAGFTPTFQAAIPDVLEDEERYTRALSLSRLAYELENLLSPTLAALALLVLSYSVLFAINGVAFLASALLVAGVALPARRPAPGGGASAWARITFGVRRYLRVPRLRALLTLDLAVACASAMVIVNTVVVVHERLGRPSSSDVALVLAASGLGAMAVALVLPRVVVGTGYRRPMLAGGLALSGALVGIALADDLVVVLLVWLLTGAALALVETPSGRVVHRSERDGDGPALFAAQFSLSHACWLVAYPLAGGLGATVGITATGLILAAIALSAALIARRLWTTDRPIPVGDSRAVGAPVELG
ncbi:MAG: MFS transporter [Solirubrobacteraceae bacterium]